MKKRLIIFDMDGTLVNSSITIANAINYVREQLGFEPMDAQEILRKVNDPHINPAQFFYHAKAFDRDHERWFSHYYSHNHDKELVLYEGIRELLDLLKERGFTLALATNAYRRSTLESLNHLEIVDSFETIVCADDVPRDKPHPDMLLKILDTLDLAPQEALFVGDGPRDKIASKRANIDYIMVDWGFSQHDDAICSVAHLQAQLLSL
jgi:phosphoglycolate phosphatase